MRRKGGTCLVCWTAGLTPSVLETRSAACDHEICITAIAIVVIVIEGVFVIVVKITDISTVYHDDADDYHYCCCCCCRDDGDGRYDC